MMWICLACAGLGLLLELSNKDKMSFPEYRATLLMEDASPRRLDHRYAEGAICQI
jgi:hypothetical protein